MGGREGSGAGDGCTGHPARAAPAPGSHRAAGGREEEEAAANPGPAGRACEH